jgi:hypothetical protein
VVVPKYNWFDLIVLDLKQVLMAPDKSMTPALASALAPATIEALKTLSTINPDQSIDDLFNCKKLTASLEQMRARRNINLFEKLNAIKQDFSDLNHKLSKMEESIINLKETTNNLVKSLPQSR